MKLKFHARMLCGVACLLSALSAFGQNYTIATFAGQGLGLGDANPALSGRFGSISAVAFGPDGSLFIADSVLHRVRKVGPDGNLSIVAGGAVRGFGGDAGPATAAMLDTPTALAVDTIGQLYIGDSGNHRVRIVTIYGTIGTVAGNGQVAPSPTLSPVLPGEGGPAISAPLNQISGLGFAEDGSLLISDMGNNRIFRVSNGNIQTVAGNATTPASTASQTALTATLGGPTAVLGDSQSNIYFTEQKTGTVRMIDPNGKLTVLIGTGSPTDTPVAKGSPLSYPLVQPVALAFDKAGDILIAEAGRVSMYIPLNFQTGTPASVQTVAGNLSLKAPIGTGDGGTALAAGMNPSSLAVDSHNNLYLADSTPVLDFHNRVRVITGTSIATFAGGNLPTGKGDKGTATAAELYFPRGLAIDPTGIVYIADTSDNRVRTVTTDGNINAFAGTGTAGTSGDQGPAGLAAVNAPQSLALDSIGNLYLTDGLLVRQVNPGGTISTFAGGGASSQEGAAALSAALIQAGSLAVDSQNNVYVDQLARLSEISATTQTIATVAGNGVAGYTGDDGPATASQLDTSAGVAVDSTGNIYIADGNNGRIRKVDATGAITTFAGGGTSTSDGVTATTAVLNIPVAVAVDATGNVYIAEYGGNRIRVVNPAGTISTIAGNGLQGFSGDGGIAINAALNRPTDVKVDALGNVYVADSMNSRIRILVPVSTVPVPAITTLRNAASFTAGPVAPGERVILTGTALGPNSTILFDTIPAPVLSSSVTSALVVVPYELAGNTTSQLTVTTDGAVSAPFTVQIAASAPGIYTVSGDGMGQAMAFLGDGSQNTPYNPAPSGSVVTILCTGEGLVSPAALTGVPMGLSPPSPILPVTATVDGQVAQVNQVYSVPGTIGQFLVEVVPPDGLFDSSASLQIMVGNSITQVAAIAVTGGSDNSNAKTAGKGKLFPSRRR